MTDGTDREAKVWDPTPLFTPSSGSQQKFAVILLNQPISLAHERTVKGLWERATLRLCADGGANRLYDGYGPDIPLPHEIRGDLDSIRDDVKSYYSSKGVQITKAASQYATDLQKCILRVEEFEESELQSRGETGGQELDVVILGGLSGRLDQTMHTLHVLCQIAETDSQACEEGDGSVREKKNKGLDENDFVTLERRKKTWVLSENSLAWILSKGSHSITVDLSRFGQTCGVMPFASSVGARKESGPRIWTKGLEWNLDGAPSAIGSFLSTSNHLKETQVDVITEAEIMWTMEVREDTGM